MRSTKKNQFMAISVITFTTALQLIAFSELAHAAPATYASSCSNERIKAGSNTGAVLLADCKTENGDTILTEIDLQGINNNNGNLTYSTEPDGYKSTFLQSCSQARISQGFLYAFCDNGTGGKNFSKLTLEDIDNANGILVYKDSKYCCVPQTSTDESDVPDIRRGPRPRDEL